MRFFFQPKQFKEPLDTRVYTTVHIVNEGSPITLISHELDGDWQFMGNEPIEDYKKVARVVSLKEIIEIDKSVLKVADLPLGHQAVRQLKSDKWTIQKIEYGEEEMKMFGFYCSKCGLYHKEIPMAYGRDAPLLYFLIPEEERENKCELTSDQCIIYGRRYYLRGHLTIPVEDNPEEFCWSVWVEVSKTDFEKISELWEDENRILEAPYVGELASQLEPYPQTDGLPVRLISQEVGLVPKVEVIETDHPLYFEQESGITMERVIFFARKLLYDH